MKSRCDACHGVRNVVALGGIKKPCDKCAGTGFISIAEAVKEVRKRGRQPRNKEVSEA